MDPIPKDDATGKPNASPWDGIADYGNMTEYERVKRAREAAKENATQELGSMLHDVWRAPRKLEDGSYDPREKQTSDAEWIERHGTNTVDIANTDFKDLPQDWKQENEDAARVLVELIHEHDADRPTKDDNGNYTEEVLAMARKVHDAWLARENNAWARGGELDVPFDELPADEQQKDIDQVLLAIKLAREDGDQAYHESGDYSRGVSVAYNKYGQRLIDELPDDGE